MLRLGPSFVTRLKKYARDSFGTIRRDGMPGLLDALYKPVQKIKGGPWLMYQMYHLHARHPRFVGERFVPRNVWPVFWYEARRKVAAYTAQPYTGRSLVLFTPKQGGEAVWKRILGQAHRSAGLQAAHQDIFSPSVAEMWQPILESELVTR